MIESSLPQSEPVLLPGRPFGQQVRNVIGYSLLTALMFITPMVVFLPAALLHCAFRNGRRIAWVVLVLSLAVASLYAFAIPAGAPEAQKMAWSYLGAMALALALPAMAAVPMVERAEKFGRVLMFLLAGALVGLALTEIGSQVLMSFSPYAAQMEQANQSSSTILQLYGADVRRAEAERWFGFSTLILPSFMLMSLSLMFILSLLMFGRLKAWHEVTARRGDSEALGAYLFRNFALPDWVLFAFILGGLTPLVTGLAQKVTANTLAVVAFLYIMQGLAIFRFMLAAVGAGLLGTLLGWTLLAVLMATGVGPLLLGVAGLFDSFFDFRHFKKRKDDSHESHSD